MRFNVTLFTRFFRPSIHLRDGLSGDDEDEHEATVLVVCCDDDFRLQVVGANERTNQEREREKREAWSAVVLHGMPSVITAGSMMMAYALHIYEYICC